jgi:hypothetical protein
MTTDDTQPTAILELPPVETVDPHVAARLFKRDAFDAIPSPTAATIQKIIDAGDLWSVLIGNEPHVLVVCKQIKRTTTYVDDNRKRWRVNGGDLLVSHMAKSESAPFEDIADLLSMIQTRLQAPMWVDVAEADTAKRRMLELAEFEGKHHSIRGNVIAYYKAWLR